MHFTALGSQVAVTIYFCLNSLPAPSGKIRKRADLGVSMSNSGHIHSCRNRTFCRLWFCFWFFFFFGSRNLHPKRTNQLSGISIPSLPSFHQFRGVMIVTLGFQDGIRGTEPACQCRRHKRGGFDPSVGKIPWRRTWQPSPVF